MAGSETGPRQNGFADRHDAEGGVDAVALKVPEDGREDALKSELAAAIACV